MGFWWFLSFLRGSLSPLAGGFGKLDPAVGRMSRRQELGQSTKQLRIQKGSPGRLLIEW